MKTSLYIISFLLTMFSCNSGTEIGDPACGHDVQCALRKAQSVCDQNKMVWLSDMLIKAEEDRISKTHKGNYIGIISLIKYKSQPVVYTNFGLGSGGIAFYLFDCDGNPVSCEDAEEAGKIPDLAKARENIIYASLNE